MNARRQSLLALATASALLSLAACSSSPASSGPADSSPKASAGATSSDADPLVALQEFAALTPDDQKGELRQVSANLERQLVTLSGLEGELGGAAAADAAFTVLTTAYEATAQDRSSASGFGRFGALVPAADAPSIAGLMFGNLMIGYLGADAAVTATNNAAAPVSRTDKDAGSSVTVSGSAAEAKIEAGTEITAGGITGKLTSVVTIAPCPDPKGQFTSTTKMTAAIGAPGGRTGSNLRVEITITGQVDDTAALVSYDTDVRTESADFANSKGQYVDQSVGWTVTGSTWGGYRSKVNRTGGSVTPSFVADQSKWGTLSAVMMQQQAIDAAKKGWESGRCVTLKTTTDPAKRKGLSPQAAVSIVATPRSTIDGLPTGGTVTAALNGGSSISPASAPADATFAYVAPDKKDASATVSLESRSKRGVAKSDLAFDTKQSAYTASGTAGNLTFSGTVADITQPFTVSATGGARVLFSYVPSDATGRTGKMTYTGSTAGFKLHGDGNYSITGDEGGVLTLTQTKGSCKAGSLQCAGGAATITLTPAG